MSTAVENANEAHRRAVLKALKRSKGRVTVGDVVAGTGLSRDDTENALRSLLSTHEGHLDVSEDGELIYLFDPKLVRRDHRSAWERFKDKAWSMFMSGFKVWIMLMLVVYFIIYVTLAIAAFVALTSQDRDSRSSFGSRRGGGLPIHWLFYIFWTPDWHYGSRYYGDRYSQGSKENKVPFYKKVFAYVFGPDEATPDPNEEERRIARFIRSRRGVITTAELVEFTGDSYMDADSKMGRLLGAFNGEAHISEEGEMIYSFPELMLSAEGDIPDKSLPPAWHKLELPKELTGNKKSTNGWITFFNSFNLVFALLSIPVLFPILQISGLFAEIGLVYIPLVFSLLFFAVPVFRSFKVKKENRKRHVNNIRKLVLRDVFDAAEPPPQELNADEVVSNVNRSLSQVKTEGKPEEVTGTLRHTVAEFDADIDIDEAGRELYKFPTITRAFQESALYRDKLALDRQELGEVVFSSADSAEEADERELRNFERELEQAEEKQREEEEFERALAAEPEEVGSR